jgi:V/A-type H+/Na+-transporting ATPase subunit E
MALADLLRAIEADAEAERARADHEAALEAAAIVERARREADAVAATLAAAPEAEARADAERRRALARLDAADAVRAAREEAFASLLAGIREELAALRASDAYPALFRALLAESRVALPSACELRVDRRDVDLAMPLARGLRVDPTLDTAGGVELASDDGRSIRNTIEERLANAELRLRYRFAQQLATTEPALARVP